MNENEINDAFICLFALFIYFSSVKRDAIFMVGDRLLCLLNFPRDFIKDYYLKRYIHLRCSSLGFFGRFKKKTSRFPRPLLLIVGILSSSLTNTFSRSIVRQPLLKCIQFSLLLMHVMSSSSSLLYQLCFSAEVALGFTLKIFVHFVSLFLFSFKN